ncbi:transcription repressor OFP15-like [Henckelia pumila]|uniref:transcription repressor OFP15-like n=1 Tax=Henckelia pumila TaxID=405737 RepID=UPI003C6DEBA7
MTKKMKLPFPLKSTENAAPWLWPTCVNNPRTLSFRSKYSNESTYKITNHDSTPPDSFLSAVASFNSENLSNPNDIINEESAATAVIQGLKSNRLFFEPGETSSILEEAAAKGKSTPRTKNIKILAMDSRDPFADFRASMEEMVEAHGLKDDWDWLEELLAYYLKVNCRSNHGYIVGAFVDLLLHLAKVSSSSSTPHCSFTSHVSVPSSTCSSPSPCLSNEETSLD